MDVKDWYKDTELSNKEYWPMDYPPLCAYFHYVMGKVVKRLMPDAVTGATLARGFMD